MSITRRSALQQQALAGLSFLGLHLGPSLAATSARPAGVDVRVPLALRVAPHRADAAQVLTPSALRLEGWLGARVSLNASRRLLNVETAPLLAGFQHKPGSHPWIGEHVGKWLHAATLAWAYNGDTRLRSKLDSVAADLIAAQESDGYLGTYVPGKRFGLHQDADWDVWSHKYCLVGLLTYYRYTGHKAALRASRKAADLLLATFPAQRSILAAGTHEGMAATSVLEPMVLLYRITGEARYLRFARYLVQAWDEPGGPGIVKSLLQGRPVNQVSNGKAYEMLANLVGLCELARVTGESPLLEATLKAWQDIVDKRLFVTGSTSQREHFQADHDMRDTVDYQIAETCVTTTWIQFNLLLLQITGEARFGDELERSFYNHLTAAQHPNGDDWCYYTALDGRKQYDKDITCCHSSGPRALALAPQATYLRARAGQHDVLLISSFESSSATLMLGGQRVTIEQRSEFPYQGRALLTLRMAQAARFALKLRAPTWAQPLHLTGATLRDGWAEVGERNWKDGDQLKLDFHLASRLHAGEHSQSDRAALAWGPFVLAYEQQANPGLPPPRKLGLFTGAMARAASQDGALRFEAEVDASLPGAAAALQRSAKFKTFADAGADQSHLRVWLRAPGVAQVTRASASLLADGEESRSRTGNVPGSIIDDDLSNLVNTWNGLFSEEDWFAVALQQSVSAARFVFTHGRNYHDGGWFDAERARPRVQIQREAQAPWETVGELSTYPATTASQSAGLQDGQQFALRLDAPVQFMALRVIGRPSSGDRPRQSFVTCGELQAFAQ